MKIAVFGFALALASAVAAAEAKPDPREYAKEWGRRAADCTRREDMKGALAILDRARGELSGTEAWKRRAAELLDDEQARVYDDFFLYREAFDFLVSKGRRLAAIRYFEKGRLGDRSLCLRLCHDVLDDPAADFDTRLHAWNWCLTREPDYADRHFPLAPTDRPARTNAVLRILADKLRVGRMWGIEGANASVAHFLDRREVIHVWREYDRLASATGAKPDFRCAQYAAVAFAGENDRPAAIAAAKRGLENDALKPEERYQLALTARVLALTGTADEIAAAIAREEPPLAKDLKADVRLARFERVGAVALSTCDEALARGCAQYRAKVSPRPPKKEYVVRFSSRAVHGVDSWDKLPFKPVKSPFDRQFGGGGTAFFATDVSTGDRGEAVAGGDGTVTLEIVADAWGLHFLRTFTDRRAREFERGFLDAGSFEEYIAPGENQPYSCFMTYPKKGPLKGGFDTAYDSPGHRRIDKKDPSLFTTDVAFTDDAILLYTGIAWENFATLVPTKDCAWDYESIFWGPVRCAWNGTESIHGRSTWGRLKFDFSDADRVQILRAIVCKAANDYLAEKKGKRGWEGVIVHWQDAVTGDPAFYDACVRPLVDELDRAAARVTPEMTDDDVRDLAENCLAKWRDFRFTVSRLRSAYLAERLSE